MNLKQAKREHGLVIEAAERILTASQQASHGNVARAILALLVASASLSRVEQMTREQFLEGAALAYDEIHKEDATSH